VLVCAAEEFACDRHLALASIDETGSAEYRGYASRGRNRWHRARDDGDEEEYDDDFDVGEIIERTRTVSDWRRPDGRQHAINALPFEKMKLCPPGKSRTLVRIVLFPHGPVELRLAETSGTSLLQEDLQKVVLQTNV
jgi:hypothetical protein